MKIGILTFYRTENFGANLQALSTYQYIKKQGHDPICIYYVSKNVYEKQLSLLSTNCQLKEHFDFVDKYMPNQTEVCYTADDINRVIESNGIEGVIVGSDAVVQHHPLLSRLYIGRRKPIYIEPVSKDRMFPNLFWGCGLMSKCKYALMSVSSQNSEYKYFSKSLKRRMSSALCNFSYISIRDMWTQNMFKTITGKEYPLTPDPVFAFKQNVGDLLPSKDYLCKKYKLPTKYLLVSMMTQSLSLQCLDELNSHFERIGVKCVYLPMPTGKGYKHNFDFVIDEPLNPLDWYALIMYSYGYVGSNMHPIIVSLSNAVPCFSIDFWGVRNFWNHPKKNGSSKVEDIMNRFGLLSNHRLIDKNQCDVTACEIFDAIVDFPRDIVQIKSVEMLKAYNIMMCNILDKIRK